MTDRSVTVLALALSDDVAAAALAQEIATRYSGQPSTLGTTEIPGTPPLHIAQLTSTVYLLQGETADIGDVAALLGVGGAGQAPQVAAQPPAPVTPAPPAPTPPTPTAPTPSAPAPITPPAPEPATPATPTPEPEPEPTTATPQPLEVPEDSFLRRPTLCTGVDDDGQPITFRGTLPEGAERVGVYLNFIDAPSDSELLLTWYRDGDVLTRRLLVVSGSRRTVNYIVPSRNGAFPSGTYWVEIAINDQLAGRLVFTAP